MLRAGKLWSKWSFAGKKEVLLSILEALYKYLVMKSQGGERSEAKISRGKPKQNLQERFPACLRSGAGAGARVVPQLWPSGKPPGSERGRPGGAELEAALSLWTPHPADMKMKPKGRNRSRVLPLLGS